MRGLRLVFYSVAMQVVAMRVEPGLSPFNVTADSRHDFPESRRMVHLDQVRNLMGREIIEHVGRRQD